MKLWAGRFEKATDHMVDDFHSSIPFDQRLYRHDILGSIAHATMLGETGIISAADAAAIIRGLNGILADLDSGALPFDPEAEDIHMFVEQVLTERIGPAGGRLHTGRSRNDQVALDMHLFVKAACHETSALLRDLLSQLVRTAKRHTRTVMPGYTHLQKAQPVTLAHHLMAWAQMFRRDDQRLADCFCRADVMPLGSGALAGTTYPLDRARVAELLGFSAISENSMDAVADRDFALEYMAAASISMMHLSRCCEELILWSTDEFRFVRMDDAFSTGSSIMPQKKNPDVAELIRGKTGRVYGDLVALLTALKGLPLAYNKDMQEDKEALFDAHDTWTKCLVVFGGMFGALMFNEPEMEKGAAGGFTNATDAADYLVKKGLPFRQAHEVAGKLVLDCVKSGRALLDVTLEEFQAYSPLFEEDLFDALSVLNCAMRRAVPGGPAPDAVAQSIASMEAYLATAAEQRTRALP
ncbi:MAG: argininosuccinate lyase [Christensenellaceae bacterium]|nr:argininosuccinate lyase [Christensenellaceae bacterium]MEA5068861.1 argininosuccinate lyase [Christensenellaceae bacterium]